jgi:hypothetical protein
MKERSKVAFGPGEIAIIQRTSQETAERVVKASMSEFREHARSVSEDTAKRAVELLAAQVRAETRTTVETISRETVDYHARTCPLPLELRGEMKDGQISTLKLIIIIVMSSGATLGIEKLASGLAHALGK